MFDYKIKPRQETKVLISPDEHLLRQGGERGKSEEENRRKAKSQESNDLR